MFFLLVMGCNQEQEAPQRIEEEGEDLSSLSGLPWEVKSPSGKGEEG